MNTLENGRGEDNQRIFQNIASNIQSILQNVSALQRTLNLLGTPQETAELKAQLHQNRRYTQQLINQTDDLLKIVANVKERHLKIQRDRLVGEFTSALTAFQNVQKKTVDIEKGAYRAAQNSGNTYSIPKPPGSYNSTAKNSSIFEENFLNDQQPDQQQIQMQETIDLEAMEEQERTIRDLEENIVGVNEIYKKLGALVYEQGQVVDSIESSVERATGFVSTGNDELRKASQYQNKLRKKKLMIVIILVVILAIIIGLICWQSN